MSARQDEIVYKLKHDIAAYDEELKSLLDFKSRINVRMKYSEVYLNFLLQELEIIRCFQSKEENVQNKINFVLQQKHIYLLRVC